MIGRKVKAIYPPAEGEVIRWEPLNHSMCDALVRDVDGHECWFASHVLKPIDSLGPLPSRRNACKRAEARAITSLEAIRAQHVKDFHVPWRGAEHGKAIVGIALDHALAELKR